jgi:hypothetical protein
MAHGHDSVRQLLFAPDPAVDGALWVLFKLCFRDRSSEGKTLS